MLNVETYMPIASYYRHIAEIHQKNASLIEHTTHNEIALIIKSNAPRTKFLDIYPGETWFNKDNSFRHRADRAQLYTPLHLAKERKKAMELAKITTNVTDKDASTFDINAYLEQLSQIAKFVNCESVNFNIRFYDSDKQYQMKNLSIDSAEEIVDITLTTYLQKLVSCLEGNYSWDELRIGWWGDWKREPDVPAMNFFRLLQLGLSGLNQNEFSITERPKKLNCIGILPVSHIIEKNPTLTSRIFSRYGLPCASCGIGHTESLLTAMNIHGISDFNQNMIMRELSWILDV
jgi:hypothetical protein